MKFECIKDVVMDSGRVAFKAGQEYKFEMKANGNIQRCFDNGIQVFQASGPDAWTVYFLAKTAK